MPKRAQHGLAGPVERLLGNLLDGSAEGVFAFDQDCRVTVWNSVMERRFGIPRVQALGKSIFETVPALAGKEESSFARSALAGKTCAIRSGALNATLSPISGEDGRIVGAMGLLRAAGDASPGAEGEPGTAPSPEWRLRELEGELRNLKEALLAQIAEHVETRRLQAANFEVTRQLGEAADEEGAVAQILRIGCEAAHWELGEFWLLDSRDGRLHWESFWHVEGLDARAFEKSSWPLALARGEEIPGRVLERGAGEWVDDLSKEEIFQRATAADRTGFCRACAVPVKGGSEAFGVLAFFSRQQAPPEKELLQALEDMARRLGIFLEVRRGAQARDRFFALSSDLLCVLGLDGALLQANPSWTAATGLAASELAGKALLELIHPADRGAAEAALRGLIEGGKETSFDCRLKRSDGSFLAVRGTASSSTSEKRVFAAFKPV